MAMVSMLLLTIPMVAIALNTDPPRALLDTATVVMVNVRLNLVMGTAQEQATTTEAPREFKDMVMEVITRGLRMPDTLMVMVNHMCTRAVLTTMALTDMRLTMSIRRGLLMPDMVMEEKATSILTDHILTTRLRFITQKHTTMDMARDLLNPDMALLTSM